MDQYHGMQIATIVRCENGYVANRSGGGTAAYDNSDKLIQKFEPGRPTSAPTSSTRSAAGGPKTWCAPCCRAIIPRPVSTWATSHIAWAKRTPSDEIRAAIAGEKTLAEAFDRFLTHLDANGIDLKKTPIRMGPMLAMDPQTERFTGPFSESANMFLSRNYREPFVVPNQV